MLGLSHWVEIGLDELTLGKQAHQAVPRLLSSIYQYSLIISIIITTKP